MYEADCDIEDAFGGLDDLLVLFGDVLHLFLKVDLFFGEGVPAFFEGDESGQVDAFGEGFVLFLDVLAYVGRVILLIYWVMV